MKRLFAAILIAGTLAAAPASFAQVAAPPQSGTGTQQPATAGKKAPAPTSPAPKKALTPQQKKMSDCSHEAKAKGFKGDQRKQFMSTCLKSD